MPANLALLNGFMQARQQAMTQKLAPKAMSGDLSALNDLMAANPEVGNQIGQVLNQRQQLMQQQQEYAQRQQNWQAEQDLAQQKFVAEQQKPAAGVFGEGVQGQAMNIIIAGSRDPSVRQTPEYQMAVATLSRPQIIQTEQGAVQVPGMDLSAFGVGAKSPVSESVIPSKTVPLQKDYNDQYEVLENARKNLINYKKVLEEKGPRFKQEVEASDLEQAYNPLINSLRELSNLKMGGQGADLLEGMIENPVIDLKENPIEAGRLKLTPEKVKENRLKGIDAAIQDLERRTETFKNKYSDSNVKQKDFTSFEKHKQQDSKDEAAIKWAKANPQDPRSKDILALHGIK